jgi:hypothetical protein
MALGGGSVQSSVKQVHFAEGWVAKHMILIVGMRDK